MKTRIVAGTILIALIVVGIALALSYTQLYPGASEAAEVEGEGNGATIDGWEIIVTESIKPPVKNLTWITSEIKELSEALSETNTTDEEVALIKAEIKKLRKVPEMEIAGTSIDRALKTVTIWVYERTAENQQLNGVTIDGWEITVTKSIKPPEKRQREIGIS